MWGPWLIHFPGPCPVQPDEIVEAEMGFATSGDIIGPMPAANIGWNCPPDPVARYRVFRVPLAEDDAAKVVDLVEVS